MRRVKKLGNVEFTKNSLFVDEDLTGSKVMCETKMSSAGSHVVYEAQIQTPYVTLNTMANGWISDAQRETLLNMYDSVGTTYLLEYDDGTTQQVRFAREKKMALQPIYEGSDWYTGIIPLATV